MTGHAGDRTVSEHYGREDLVEKILAALRAAGKDPDRLTPEDLAPVDQFHTRGAPATLDLARRAGVSSGMRALDVGGGLGAPARTLASEFGCPVEVLDITEEFCHAGEALTARTGLGDLVAFRLGSALDMPHPDASFDLVWTQHSTMNIGDKRRLYQEAHRVLRPGGRLARHEISAGDNSPIHFPVPWARGPEINHLLASDELQDEVSSAGFTELSWTDETQTATEWFEQRLAASASSETTPRPRLRRAVQKPPDKPQRGPGSRRPGRPRETVATRAYRESFPATASRVAETLLQAAPPSHHLTTAPGKGYGDVTKGKNALGKGDYSDIRKSS